MRFGKIGLVLIILLSLVLSAVYSMKSFTGYLISDIADNSSNLVSFLFFSLGIFSSWIYISKFSNK